MSKETEDNRASQVISALSEFSSVQSEYNEEVLKAANVVGDECLIIKSQVICNHVESCRWRSNKRKCVGVCQGKQDEEQCLKHPKQCRWDANLKCIGKSNQTPSPTETSSTTSPSVTESSEPSITASFESFFTASSTPSAKPTVAESKSPSIISISNLTPEYSSPLSSTLSEGEESKETEEDGKGKGKGKECYINTNECLVLACPGKGKVSTISFTIFS